MAGYCRLIAQRSTRFGLCAGLIVLFAFGHTVYAQAPASGSLDDLEEVDREYTFEATMLGYTGIGGMIDGIRNPVLQARKGETVRLTIINGETMPHDIAMEQLGVASDIIVEEGATTSVTFVAEEDDIYYCTIPGHRAGGMEGRFKVVDGPIEDMVVELGMIPEMDGRPLNLNFETGTLEDWTATGDAFEGQPVTTDPSPFYDEDTEVGSTGQYFVSSGGSTRFETTGTLTSVPFDVTEPYAAFWVSGGALRDTRVELVLADADSVLFQITGNNHARLRPVVVELEPYMGREIFVRIIDQDTGEDPHPYRSNSWAHINFDDFRFYSSRPEFPNELRPEEIFILPPRDFVPHAGLSGIEASRSMDVPDGFSVTLAASEPDIIRPIAFSIDERGRLWVVEGHTYPVRAPDGEGKDRILIFEDTNGDGQLDERTVFIEGLNLVSGIEVGFGGVWVGAAPYLMFIPIADDGVSPAGEPEVLLDGWGYQDTHETLNSFTWGPDGWLYGAHGVFTHSNVGKPGEADEGRQPINAGIWRFHPTRHEFEVYAWGTSNPWGIDYNDVGHFFTTVCVIPHLYHVIQGARYQRQAGEHFNPHVFDDIKTIADHVHYVGDNWVAGTGRSGEAGGGHAHAGAMFYLGNEHWNQDRNAILMNNIHGYRMNRDHIERSGTGYVATHGDDFLLTNDAWSQWVSMQYGPDGSVYAIDWYDKNQCHSSNPDVHETTLGRIFRISHEQDEWVEVDLSTRSSSELVELQLHENDWYVRQARRILQERGPDAEVHRALRTIFDEHPELSRKLRALWALHSTEGLSKADLQDLLDHESEYVRGWAVKLLTEDRTYSDETLGRFAEMARRDESALVRVYLASALQRMDPEQRWDILEGLYERSEDAGDHNQPLMVWYAAETMAEVDMDRALDMAFETELPNILNYTVQRIGRIGSQEALLTLERHQSRLDDSDHHREISIMIDRFVKEGE